jgi:hypothetical protein
MFAKIKFEVPAGALGEIVCRDQMQRVFIFYRCAESVAASGSNQVKGTVIVEASTI